MRCLVVALSLLLPRHSSHILMTGWLFPQVESRHSLSPLLCEPENLHSEWQQRQPYTQSASSLPGHVSQLSVKYSLFLRLQGMLTAASTVVPLDLLWSGWMVSIQTPKGTRVVSNLCLQSQPQDSVPKSFPLKCLSSSQVSLIWNFRENQKPNPALIYTPVTVTVFFFFFFFFRFSTLLLCRGWWQIPQENWLGGEANTQTPLSLPLSLSSPLLLSFCFPLTLCVTQTL